MFSLVSIYFGVLVCDSIELPFDASTMHLPKIAGVFLGGEQPTAKVGLQFYIRTVQYMSTCICVCVLIKSNRLVSEEDSLCMKTFHSIVEMNSNKEDDIGAATNSHLPSYLLIV